MGKWVFWAFLIAALLIVLSRSAAFSTAIGALSKGSSTIGRTILGENPAGTAFIPQA